MHVQSIIDNFKTNVCPLWLRQCCPLADRDCFDSHNFRPQRRKPCIINGEFNYLPGRCRDFSTATGCDKGDACHYSHDVYETIVHPKTFRTEFCLRLPNCPFGRSCTRAHALCELRLPATELVPANENFDVRVYRTQRCHGFPFHCNCLGLYYHAVQERRRENVASYIPTPCPLVKVGDEWSPDPSNRPGCMLSPRAKEGDPWTCVFAHTRMETLFHPAIWKTKDCQRFSQEGYCKFGKQCSHAHGNDKRRPSKAWPVKMGK